MLKQYDFVCFRGKYLSKKVKYDGHFEIQNSTAEYNQKKNWTNSGFVPNFLRVLEGKKHWFH